MCCKCSAGSYPEAQGNLKGTAPVNEHRSSEHKSTRLLLDPQDPAMLAAGH